MADKRDWVTNPTKYRLYTTVLKPSLNGGVVHESDIAEEQRQHIEEGIELGLIDREKLYTCADSTCKKTYSGDYTEDKCLCGTRFPDEDDEMDIANRQPNTGHFSTRYQVSDPPHLYSTVIGETLAGHPMEWDFVDYSTAVKGYNLSRTTGKASLHVSPFYDFDAMAVTPECCTDIFFSWEQLPEIATADDQDAAAEAAIENAQTLPATQATSTSSSGTSVSPGNFS